MIRRLQRAILAPLFVSSVAWSAFAQTATVYGSVYIHDPTRASPRPAAGYEVFLYSATARRYIGPSVVDNFGRFAFYDVPGGTYLLRIYRATKRLVWQQGVRAPGRVSPIVLPAANN